MDSRLFVFTSLWINTACLASSKWLYSISHIGCYNHNVNPEKSIVIGELTHEKCWNFCYSKRLQYAMLQSPNECGCSQFFKRENPLANTGCNNTCAGNVTQACGDGSSTNVFGVHFGPCDKGWLHNSEFRGCYRFVYDGLNWKNAKNSCSENSASLLMVNSKREQYFIDMHLFYNYEDQWIGSRYRSLTNVYMWQDDSLIIYNNWLEVHEPKLLAGWCARLHKNVYWDGYITNTFTWGTANCNTTKHFICEKPARQCPNVPSVGNAIADTRSTGLGVAVNYKCQKGHVFPEGTANKTIECRLDHWNSTAVNWTDFPSPCEPVKCPQIKGISNVILDTTSRIYRTAVLISCIEGYRVQPGQLMNTTAICQANKTWTRLPDSCEKAICPPLPVINNSTSYGNDTEYGGIVAFSCDTEFMFPDRNLNKTITCTADAQWNETLTACVIVSCPVLGVPHSKLSTDNRTLSTVVTVSCLEGYKYHGNITSISVECMVNTFWNDTVPDCAPVQCPKIPAGVTTKDNKTGTDYDTRLTVICPPGQEFLDGNTSLKVRCGPLGYWIPTLLSCDDIIDAKALRYLPPKEAPAAVVVGTWVVGLLVGLGCFIIFLDLGTLYRDIKMLKRNLKWIYKKTKRYISAQTNGPTYNYGPHRS